LKRLLQSSAVITAASGLLAAYLRFCYATMRWRVEGEEHAAAIWDRGGPVIVCFWHERIGTAPRTWPRGRAQPIRALVSLSRDGEFIARAMGAIGFSAIRGSSAKASAPDKVKGGAEAFREALRWLKAGNAVALTPDGPRGPRRQMAEGAPMLAKAAGAPVLFLGTACAPRIQLGGWDRGTLPVPFGRGAVVWTGPVTAGRDAEVEALRRDWAERLTAATERAGELLA
jgi:lysophospholipid acyltransferase (LPLAT)-like uncharacterized protein